MASELPLFIFPSGWKALLLGDELPKHGLGLDPRGWGGFAVRCAKSKICSAIDAKYGGIALWLTYEPDAP